MKKLLLLATMHIFFFTGNVSAQFGMSQGTKKVATTMTLIEKMYVDNVDDNKLAEDAIVALLEKLDPHSSYLSKETVAEMNEPLEGNFDGIGIAFNMMTDTLYVIETIADGPSERAGILPGDRIITVNDTVIAGVKMSTKDIMKRLKGPKGTKVKVQVSRRGMNTLLDFQLTRAKIPIYSLDASYMVDKHTGYIRLSRFGATTISEFREALEKLKAEGLENLILDLQGNGGGYLSAASDLANDFVGKDKLIVYMEGAHQSKVTDVSSKKGAFESGKLVILVDEGSASASEIVSGATQDWDRGVIVGRRTFGKGLVQRQFPLPDGSMIRLTVSRYYTPTGRSIQKPYIGGNQDAYNKDLIDRYNRGEMMNADSIHFPDSLKYQTLVNKRTVYGGGGIMPDYFVPIDTTDYSEYSAKLTAYGTIYKIALNEVDHNRANLLKKYPTINEYKKGYDVSEELLQKMIAIATEDKIEYNEDQFKRSKKVLKKRIKALIARDLYDTSAYFKIINDESDIFKKGFDIINNNKEYYKLLGSSKQ
jgi:carboxyl-terminal processing protease